jgi:predicted transcriptional regulator of viral defense system
MQSTHYLIKNAIIKKRRGKIIFADDFRSLGTGVAIRHALSRLSKDEFIMRLSNGIYLYPKISKLIGTVYPSIEDIAKAIAKKEKARLIPTGLYALNRLGLSTQVPMRVVFLTDGAPRVIKVGKKATIRFKKTVAKYLAFKGKITTLVIFALKEIGKDKVIDSQCELIREALTFEKEENIIHDASLAPEWISQIIQKIITNE